MSDIDVQFIEYIVKSLVGQPDAVSIKRTIDDKGVLLELTVDPDDLGRVIGKRGATAQSLRTLLRALGTKNDARYNLKIIDNGPPREDRPQSDAPAPAAKDDPSINDDTSTATSDDDALEEAVNLHEPEEVSEEPTDSPEELEAAEDRNAGASDMASRTRQELEDLDDLDV